MDNVDSQLSHCIFRAIHKFFGAKHSPELHVVVFEDIVEKFLHNFHPRSHILPVVYVEALKIHLVQLFALLPLTELKKGLITT